MRRVVQLIRDLALVPAIWRRLVDAERKRRMVSPQGERLLGLAGLREDRL